MKQKAVIIGGGIGGLATAILLAKKGFEVELVEKNEKIGGRANVFEAQGFKFDMGPSWYLMPDVFEHFFNLVGEKIEDHLELQQLTPSYRIFFKDEGKVLDLQSNVAEDKKLFESLEPGSGAKLEEYLALSKIQYEIAVKDFMYKNYDSIFDFFNKRVMTEGRKLSVLSKMNKYVERFFKSEIIQKIMQYQLVFLGSSPYNTPALYNIMSHIDFNMGVFYPKGGIYKIIEALVTIAKKNGVVFRTSSPVGKIIIENKKTTGVELESGEVIAADLVISNADIEHTEMKLLPKESQTLKERYWKKRTMAPSAFIMYIGMKDKVPSLTHHNLIFCKDWKKNFAEIFDNPQWPDDPSLYVCCPSKTDPTVAPEGKENLFVLVPVASGLEYDDATLDAYKDKILSIMEKEMNIPNFKNRIEYIRTYSLKDFAKDYNAYKGSALGLAHTIMQTAFFRPNNRSKKVSNLYYVGAGTNPGIGMPICLISAELAYKRIMNITDPEPLKKL
ncbi:MAG: phytoene desaturase family protein [Patescibacteria group bacterium]